MPENEPQDQNAGGQPVSAQEKRLKRQQQKQALQESSRRKHSLTQILYIAAGVALAAAAVYFIIQAAKTAQPQAEDFSMPYPIQSRDHIAVGANHPEYNSNPPTSGWHYAQWLTDSNPKAEAPDEQLIHNLEHGHVWISYQPDIPQEVITRLETYADQWTVVTPRSKNEKDIAVAAWGRLDAFDLENGALTETLTTRINDFIKRYLHKGPENVPVSSGMGVR